jgi:hypothetical protein
MTITWVPLASTPTRALLGIPVILAVGVAAGWQVHRRNQRIVRNGLELRARVVAAEVIVPDDELAATRLRHVRLVLAFEGAEDEPQTYQGWRMKTADAATFAPGMTLRAWVLADDPSEIRVARPSGAGGPLPFNAS